MDYLHVGIFFGFLFGYLFIHFFFFAVAKTIRFFSSSSSSSFSLFSSRCSKGVFFFVLCLPWGVLAVLSLALFSVLFVGTVRLVTSLSWKQVSNLLPGNNRNSSWTLVIGDDDDEDDEDEDGENATRVPRYSQCYRNRATNETLLVE